MKTILFLLCLLLLPLPALAEESVNLPVPHLWEIPDGSWIPPWSGACEESSMMMVEAYYLKNKKIKFTATEAKNMMRPLFAIEDKLFGSNLDTNSTRTATVINDYTSFEATTKKNPTLEEIKNELLAARPVISLHLGFDLKNPLHRFRRGGSSFHMMVITGFDEQKKEFLVNDPELQNGLDFRYKYDIILNSLHDFNHTNHKADGEPTVLFTRSKQFVRAEGTKRLYLIRDNKKYLILTPSVMSKHRWSWSLIKIVSKAELAAVPYGGAIEK